MFDPFPIFSMDYLDCSSAGDGLLKVHFRLTICGTGEPGRYRVLGKYQIGEPGSNSDNITVFLSSEITNFIKNFKIITRTKIPYTKQAKSLDEQIDILRSRNVVIRDEEKTSRGKAQYHNRGDCRTVLLRF